MLLNNPLVKRSFMMIYFVTEKRISASLLWRQSILCKMIIILSNANRSMLIGFSHCYFFMLLPVLSILKLLFLYFKWVMNNVYIAGYFLRGEYNMLTVLNWEDNRRQKATELTYQLYYLIDVLL